VGKKYELSFSLEHPFVNPFRRDRVDIKADIIQPDGALQQVRAFYYEDFLCDFTQEKAPLMPYGRPRFKLRYTPLAPGPHQLILRGTVDGVDIELPPQELVVKPVQRGSKPFKGFLRPSQKDHRLLEYSGDGSEYWGVGLNVRSPFDTRYMESFAFSQWPDDYDLPMYRRLFEKYRDNGIDFAEVWMSPWWMALEWINDAPGNHGVGYLNPWRAWKLDKIFEYAEEFDIKIILLINNHGKFSSWCDADWERNPWNSALGGSLDLPREYFYKDQAKLEFKRLADYIVARWGHSPNLMAWKLFSEIDLTGNNRQWYRDSRVTQWHREMASYVKRIDPNRHMVTTHWATSYRLVNLDLAIRPELDILTLDAYFGNTQTGAYHLPKLFINTFAFQKRVTKPCIITEFGGSPWADSMADMKHQFHLSLWMGFMGDFATGPCFWWFPLVEEEDMYGEYKALREFTRGETRAGSTISQQTLKDGAYRLWEMQRGDDAFYYVFDTAYFYSYQQNQEPTERVGESIPVTGLAKGDYVVEFWETETGTVVSKDNLKVTSLDSQIQLNLPPFKADMAIKVKKQ
jgi:hypothetical protein